MDMHAFLNLKQISSFLLFVTGVLSYSGAQGADSPIQLNIERDIASTSQLLLSWQTELSQVYFVQKSDDLVNWSWYSFHLPEGVVILEENVSTENDQAFFRLQYTEFSSANTSLLLTGDFDNDSISNYDEINTYTIMGLDPLDADSDGNGTIDGFEDADGDGQNNAFEFAQGRLPDIPDADVAMYIDAIFGSASYNGLSAIPGRPTAVDGPKADIVSAIEAAADNDVILLQSGAYDETTLSLNGKNLTIRLNGSVTIQ